jgi:hypothetical protein
VIPSIAVSGFLQIFSVFSVLKVLQFSCHGARTQAKSFNTENTEKCHRGHGEFFSNLLYEFDFFLCQYLRFKTLAGARLLLERFAPAQGLRGPKSLHRKVGRLT